MIQLRDILHMNSRALRAQRLRSMLTALGIAVGVAAVVLLTSIGEGVHRFVLSEFTQFGTNLVAINPGRATTAGASIGVFGTERPLTVQDALALTRLPRVTGVVPVVQGNAEVEGASRQRRTSVYGVGPDFPQTFLFTTSSGRFLPEDDPESPRAFAVLGSTVRSELFGNQNPLGARIRIGGNRYRVIGSMESKGQVLGFDLDDAVYIPASRALELFNRDSLVEIDLLYEEGSDVDEIVESIKRVLTARHGREDYTITTQQQMLDVLGGVLDILTMAIGAMGGISLLVGAVGIISIMTIAVRERTSEIGLLRALGAEQNHILRLFLGEAVLLAALGGLAGLVIGGGGALLLNLLLPALPVHISLLYVILAEAVALLVGLAAGLIPARRAARLDPIEALRTE
ncbi:MAG: ABC transporter permease [Granulosicoccaceae bacterium]|jgi:putative ABC transport system permease protein